MEDRKFKLLVVTPEGRYPKEAVWINRLFEAGLECLHLRKPGRDYRQLLAYVRQIDEAFYPRIMLHHEERLLEEGAFRGVHYRPAALPLHKPAYTVSCGIHSWQELRQLEERFSYSLLSPFFDSISKRGYAANPSLQAIPAGVNPEKVIALGGVGSSNISQLYQMGLGGAAVLGSIWQSPSPLEAFNQLKSAQALCRRQDPM